jgi:hypothetical protein
MKNIIDFDCDSKSQKFLFESNQLDQSNIRLRPAEFARIIDCSKQAVSIWIRDGKITLGLDGRLNPGVAITQLLKNSNPSMLRAKVLKPLVKQIKICEEKINKLEAEIEHLKESNEFNEGVVDEHLSIFALVEDQLLSEIDLLSDSPSSQVILAFLKWLSEVRQCADLPEDFMISDFITADTEALEDKEG